MKGQFEKRIISSLPENWIDIDKETPIRNLILKLVVEAQKELPEIIIRKDGLVILKDTDYDHDIILGQMNMEAYKNIEEARKSLKKFEKWFGSEEVK